MQDTFPLEITHVRGDECQMETTRLIKQTVTVHEISRKAEPFNVNQKVVQVINFDQIE